MISPIEGIHSTYTRHQLRDDVPEDQYLQSSRESFSEKNFAERAIAKHPAISLVLAGAVGIAVGCLLKRRF